MRFKRSTLLAVLVALAAAVLMPQHAWAFTAPQEVEHADNRAAESMGGNAGLSEGPKPQMPIKGGLQKISMYGVLHALASGDPASAAASAAAQLLRGASLAQGLSLQAGPAHTVQAPDFGARLKTSSADRSGNRHVRINQTYQGVPVAGAEVIMHINAQNRIYRITGTYLATLNISVEPTISAQDALAVGLQDLRDKTDVTVYREPRLAIINQRLAYHYIVAHEGPDLGQWVYYVDAHNGAVIWRYSDIKTDAPGSDGEYVTVQGLRLEGEDGANLSIEGWHDTDSTNHFLYNRALKWRIFDYIDQDWEQQAGPDWGGSDRAAISAAYNLVLTQDYVTKVLARDSYDDEGAIVKANVHDDYLGVVSAYWGLGRLGFGDGDGLQANAFSVLDVVAHEFGHAITEYTSELIYMKESGALNEGYSDILGALVEFRYQEEDTASYPTSSPGMSDWLLGEDCWLLGEAIRNLRDPNSYNLPSYYKGTHWHALDNHKDYFGVHTNSSVLNHAFYLLAEGGSGTNDGNDYDLTGIGIEAAGLIAMHANIDHHTQSDGYVEARVAWADAADDSDLDPDTVQAVHAVFDAVGVPMSYGVTFNATDGGRIVGNARQQIIEGEDCTPVTAEADSGYEFDGWSGGHTGDENPLTLRDITKKMAVTANFIAIHAVRFTAGPGGSLTGTTSQQVRNGEDATAVTAEADDGYAFVGWSGDRTGNQNPLTLTNVTSPMNVRANFIAIHDVNFSAGAGGSIVGESNQSVHDGEDTAPVTARPDDGFSFSGWTGDHTGDENPLTLQNVTGPMNVTANFVAAPTMHTVLFTAGDNGTIEGNTIQEVKDGQDCSEITARPKDGYVFDGWSGDHTGDDNPLTLTNITKSMTVEAKFKVAPSGHIVTFSAGDGGSISGNSSQEVEDGMNCEPVTAEPDNGYVFDGWTGDHTGTDNPLTLTNITADMDITATFVSDDNNGKSGGGGGGGCFLSIVTGQ